MTYIMRLCLIFLAKELERNNLYRSRSIFDLASRLGIFRIVWLCERFHNAEDGQKDKSDVKVVS